MRRKTLATLFTVLLILSITACGNTASTTASNTDTTAKVEIATQVQETTNVSTNVEANSLISTDAVDNHLAEDTDTLISTYAGKFTQETYTDPTTGLSITYNLYLPENYDSSETYPMVVFIGDSSCAGTDATVSLTQGRGALVWTTDEWQSQNPTIVAVPTYPMTILDDHGSYTQTEYVELTKRFIDYMSSEYAVDTNRIYGTGQSMGCMTTLILASSYPDLYAACMFVDGQWDISTLEGLENQTFVYFAAEDDTNAWNGSQEVMAMFSDDSVTYEYAQWDGTWSVDELSDAASLLFSSDENQYFISWETGTIEPKSDSMGSGNSGFGNEPSSGFGAEDKNNADISKPTNGEFQAKDGEFPAKDGEFPAKDGEMSGMGEMSEMGGNMEGGMNSSAYHMASFDYAYNCVAVMEWLFEQHK